MPLRLKSLELHGYKTFASRTLFEFSSTITAIVGPNGSGKSNIADSLRWVLGEQSYSLLRGKKTEDMIFSGSEQRSRASMASATVTFDNEDGWLPIDFSEVTIARRAYRDGQNEYLINNQRMRLKDVTELLAQSGLAERTYTIIGQGLVDAALALKAEERRRLFEEAAGTGLHRARREEALRRLEATKRNLERVQDILAELQPRLRSLERQARRAQEYEQIRADLQVLLREWYGYHWHRTQKELSAAREAARSQESLLEKARLRQGELDKELSGLRDRVLALRASLNSWHRQSSQLHERREALSRELAVADERLRAFQDQQHALRSDLDGLQAELSLHKDRRVQAEQEVTRLEEELEEAQTQVSAARRALEDRRNEREQAERELQKVRRSLAELHTSSNQLQARQTERQAQTGRAQEDLAAAAKALEIAEGEIKQAEEKFKLAQVELERAQAGRKALEADLAEQRLHQSRLEQAREGMQENLSATRAERARLQAQFDVIQTAEKSLTGYAGGTRLLLQAAQQARLRGARGALSNYLEVPSELELAVSAALGDYLDAVVLDEGLDPALDLLQDRAERAVLLPLRSLKPVPSIPAALVRSKAVIGIAADLVKALPELRPAIDLLLGNVLVVEDRDVARRLLPDIPPGARMVTLVGEVFLASGPVISVPAGKEKSNGNLLSRQRQQRELQSALEQIASELQKLGAQAVQIEDQHRTVQAETERQAQLLRSAQQDEQVAAMAVNQARLVVEHAQQQAHWQRAQVEKLQEDIRLGEAESLQIRADLKNLEIQTGEVSEQVRQHAAALASLTLDESQARVSHWGTQVAVAERALVDGKTRLSERQAALDNRIEAVRQRRERLETLIQAREDLEQAKVVQRQEEGEVNGEIDALRLLIEPAEAELEALEHEQINQQDAESRSRAELNKAEHHHAQARITLARRQEALDTLRRRIEDDFGLVAFEYSEEVSGPTPLPFQGMVEQLPMISQITPEVEDTIKRQRAQLRRMGPVNPEAQTEYQEVKQRFQFLTEQVGDLEKATVDIRQVIAELDELMQREFRKTFDAVATEFHDIFMRLFEGGTARLMLTDPDDLTNTGIDIEARLPGRRTQGLSLLSGGERSLTATALVFALLRVSPTPFCVLDEVDAMLDEANVGRFRDLLRELSENTQFIVVTHNRNTVQVAEVIYGVTMGRDSVSQILSLKLDEVAKLVK
ncbi:MAG: chromosome segregation protein SMC [Anaerolineales bacterium]|jgi:chromosome segregation protein